MCFYMLPMNILTIRKHSLILVIEKGIVAYVGRLSPWVGRKEQRRRALHMLGVLSYLRLELTSAISAMTSICL